MIVLNHRRWSPHTIEIVVPVATNEELLHVYNSLVSSALLAEQSWKNRLHQMIRDSIASGLTAFQSRRSEIVPRDCPHILYSMRHNRKAVIEYWPPHKVAMADWSHGPPEKRITIIKQKDRPQGLSRKMAMLEDTLEVFYEVRHGEVVRH